MMENSNSSSVDDPGSIFLESVTSSVTLSKESEDEDATVQGSNVVLTPTIIQDIKEELVSVPFEVITLPDGMQAIYTPETILQENSLLIKSSDEEEMDMSMTVIEEPEISIDTSPDVIEEANVIQLENGTYAYVHNQPQDGCHVVKLEDGSTAYITLTRGVVEEDEDDDDDDEETVNTVEVEEQTLHVDEKKSRPSFRCTYTGCGRLYTTIHHLKVHERSHTGARPYLCTDPGCNKAFATDYGRKAHYRTHTGEKPYHCKEHDCTKSFKTSGDLQKHTRTHTGERPFACPVEGCDRSFTTSNIRKVHIRTHTGEKPYVCTHPGCERSFASATNFKNHMRIHSGEKPFVCEWPDCQKRFTEYSSLYKHHLVHTKEKPYHCNICGHNYRQVSTLVVHKRTAHGVIEADDGTELILGNVFGVSGAKKLRNLANNVNGRSQATSPQPFACTVQGCNKWFITEAEKVAHVKFHSEPKHFVCELSDCSKRFKTASELLRHTKMHTGERPFPCPVEGCDRSFTTSGIRKVHIRTHTGEKPYVCTHPGCDRSFANVTNFKNHTRIHSGEKPFACEWPGCEKRFTEYSTLCKHQLAHCKDKWYQCNLCGHVYRQISTLAAHKRTAHDIIEPEDRTEIVFGNIFGISHSKENAKKLKSFANNLLSNLTGEAGRTVVALQSTDEYIEEVEEQNQIYILTGDNLEQALQTINETAELDAALEPLTG